MQAFLDLCAIAIGVVSIYSYLWSTRYHFSSDYTPMGAALIFILVGASSMVFTTQILTYEQPEPAMVGGIVVELASLGLFWWAIRATRTARLRYAFDENAPRGLVVHGPYRYLRHPFYVSYLGLWAGWAVATASAYALIPVVVFGIIYTIAARGEERSFMASDLRESYDAYRRSVRL